MFLRETTFSLSEVRIKVKLAEASFSIVFTFVQNSSLFSNFTTTCDESTASCAPTPINWIGTSNNIERNWREKTRKFNRKGKEKTNAQTFDRSFRPFSSQILRLTQHNKRSNERLNELQRCLDQIKGTITGQNTFDQLRDILR